MSLNGLKLTGRFLFKGLILLFISLGILGFLGAKPVQAGSHPVPPDTINEVISILQELERVTGEIQQIPGYNALISELPSLRTLTLDTEQLAKDALVFSENLRTFNNYVGGAIGGQGELWQKLKSLADELLQKGEALSQKIDQGEQIDSSEVLEMISLGLRIRDHLEKGAAPLLALSTSGPQVVSGVQKVISDAQALDQELQQLDLSQFKSQFQISTQNLEAAIQDNINRAKVELQPAIDEGAVLLVVLGGMQFFCLGADDVPQCLAEQFDNWFQGADVQLFLNQTLPDAADRAFNELTDLDPLLEAAMEDLKDSSAIIEGFRTGTVTITVTPTGNAREFRFEVVASVSSLIPLIAPVYAQNNQYCAWLLGQTDNLQDVISDNRCSFIRQLDPGEEITVAVGILENKQQGAIGSSTCKKVEADSGQVSDTSQCPAASLVRNGNGGPPPPPVNGNGGNGNGGNGNGNGDLPPPPDGNGGNGNGGQPGGGGTFVFENPLTAQNIVELFERIAGWLMLFAVVLAVAMAIIAGIMYAASGGSSERVGTATRALVWTLVGLAIILIARGIVEIIKSILGVEFIPREEALLEILMKLLA
jgi:hypothetical protein